MTITATVGGMTVTDGAITGAFALSGDTVQVSEGGTGASTAQAALSNLGGIGIPIAMAYMAMM